MTAATFSLLFSGCFVTLLIGGSTTVDGLVSEKLEAQPTATVGFHPTHTMKANSSYGEPTMPFTCGNQAPNCMAMCSFCYELYGGQTMQCLSELCNHFCFTNFVRAMEALNYSDWCVWGNVRSLYSNLSLCSEEISDCVLIPWPNPVVEEMFVEIHSKYFKDCPTEELSDPPPVILFTLVIIPICLIPVMVSLVVLKTKNGDGSS